MVHVNISVCCQFLAKQPLDCDAAWVISSGSQPGDPLTRWNCLNIAGTLGWWGMVDSDLAQAPKYTLGHHN